MINNDKEQLSFTENKVDAILAKLCESVVVPQITILTNNHQDKYLIECMETQNYPYPMLHCQHLEEKNIGEDCVECQHEQYETYKLRFHSLAAERGYDNTHVLKAAFDYYAALITQYRLTECDELLNTIYSVCISRGTWSTYYVSLIQALAFLRFKQGRYRESIEYFNKQLEIQGPHEGVYENLALSYAKLQQNKQASLCYAYAIHLIRQKQIEKQRPVTLLMGLAVVLENSEDAMALLQEALILLRDRYDKPHSLMAKTLTAMGDLHLSRQDIAAAEACYDEAVRIFIDTCGFETPLTAKAMSKHASILFISGYNDQAMNVFLNSLRIWIKVDDQSFDSSSAAEALMVFNKEKFFSEELLMVLDLLRNKLVMSPFFENDLSTVCLLKFVTEIYILNKDFSRAIFCCQSFIDCLNKMNEEKLGENAPYRKQFLAEMNELLCLMETIKNVESD